MRPETTGETENGKSIRVTRNPLPQKSNLETAQEAEIPNTAFSGTAMAAVISVSRIAASASGSVIALQASERPSPNASLNTTMSGTMRKAPMNDSATNVNNQRNSK